MLKAKDIQIMYSEKVESYLRKGYIINTESMSGHQGEICKVDLRKGNEVIRVVLLGCAWVRNDDGDFEDYIVLQTLRYESTSDRLKDRETLWMNKGELVEEVRFYEISSYKEVYTMDHEEYKRCRKLRYQRSDRRYVRDQSEIKFDPKKLIKIVNSKKGFKTAKQTDIQSVERKYYNNRVYYKIRVKGKYICIGY